MEIFALLLILVAGLLAMLLVANLQEEGLKRERSERLETRQQRDLDVGATEEFRHLKAEVQRFARVVKSL